eukprot:sb/3464180/
MSDKPAEPAALTTQQPPQQTTPSTEPNVSLLYVKRKRSAPAPTASLYVEVEAKRQRVFNEFKLVTSTSSEPRKLDRSELYRRYKHEETSISDIRGRCRTEGDERRRAAKYNIISTHRGEQGDVLAAEEEGSEHDDLCQRLINNKLSHDVTHDVTMPHPYTFLDGGEEEWIYDVYLCEGAMRGQGIGISDNNWELDDDHEVVRERYVGDYDEDSNDENHWANEYPDEGDDSDSDYNGEFGGGDSDDQLLQNLRCSNDYYDSSDIMWKSDKYLRSDTSESEGEEVGKLNFLVYKYLSQPQFATARDAFRQALLGDDRALPDASILGDHSPEQNIQHLGSDDTLVKIWSLDRYFLLATLRGHSREISDLAINRSDTLLASGSCDKEIRIWCLQTSQNLTVLLGHRKEITYLQFSPNNDYLATCANDNLVNFWPITEETNVSDDPITFCERVTGQDKLLCSSFSSGGAVFAVGSGTGDIFTYTIQGYVGVGWG